MYARRLVPFLLAISIASVAQTQIPAGTILPAQLSSTIDSSKAKPGDRVSARLMQDIHLSGGQKLSARTQLLGKVLSVDPFYVTLAFDRIVFHHRVIPIHTDLRSLASPAEVEDAQMPTNTAGGDRGSSRDDWNTIQVGGEAVYGRGGPVMSGTRVVGHSVLGGGVLAIPEASSQLKCRGDLANGQLQSFWIFASSACGAYGFEDLTIQHVGQTDPVGTIVLTSPQGIKLRSGTGLLLRVIPD